MDREIPSEWESLPNWVKDELAHGKEDLTFYSGVIQRLVDHSTNMQSVWALVERHRHAFKRVGPVAALLEVLFRVAIGLDPGLRRTDDDRRVIAESMDKQVNELLKLLRTLATNAPFAHTVVVDQGNSETPRLGDLSGELPRASSAYGLYPAGVLSSLTIAAHQAADKRVRPPFKELSEEIFECLGESIDAETKHRLGGSLEFYQDALEQEFIQGFMDPAPALRALAKSTREWADLFGWGRREQVEHVATALRRWTGRNQYNATAVLLTAICEEEISRDCVSGLMKRRAARMRNLFTAT